MIAARRAGGMLAPTLRSNSRLAVSHRAFTLARPGLVAKARPQVASPALVRLLSSGSDLKITEQEVLDAQKKWADTLISIGKTYTEGGKYVDAALAAAGDLYAFNFVDTIMFKPTRCAEVQFRPKPTDALSYFVGGEHKEDGGFAISPPFAKIEWANHAIDINGDTAIAMGNYWFTAATTGNVSKVEYTFGYRKYKPDAVRIFLHHSSVPFVHPPK